jgi:hypothetical protein
MPVPSWAAIPDADVDLESPLTESLMQRMRNQWAAFMGVDPTSVTQPAFTLPASTQNVENSYYLTASGGTGAWATTAEATVSVVADDIEDMQIGQGIYYLSTYHGILVPHFTQSLATAGISYRAAQIVSINVPYVTGVPQSVDVFFVTESLASAGSSTVSLPIDDAWHSLVNFASGRLEIEGKARGTATHVYLTLRAKTDGNDGDSGPVIRFPFVRKSFKSKN